MKTQIAIQSRSFMLSWFRNLGFGKNLFKDKKREKFVGVDEQYKGFPYSRIWIPLVEFSKRYNCCSYTSMRRFYNEYVTEEFFCEIGGVKMVDYRRFFSFLKNNPEISIKMYNKAAENNFYGMEI